MKPRLSKRKTAGLTLVEVLVIVLVVGLLFILLYPWPEPSAKKKAQRISCLNNLKQIGLSFNSWAGDNNEKFPMDVSIVNGGVMELAVTGNVTAVFQIMSNELSTPKILRCPADESRFVATNFHLNFSAKNISYFVDLDATTNPPTAIFAGDDNLQIDGRPIPSGLIELSAGSAANWTTNRHWSGNIVFAYTHVQQFNNFDFSKLLKQSGIATNRLILP